VQACELCIFQAALQFSKLDPGCWHSCSNVCSCAARLLASDLRLFTHRICTLLVVILCFFIAALSLALVVPHAQCNRAHAAVVHSVILCS
jgi:hypothetical protein